MRNPFRGMRFALLDFKNARGSTIMKVAMTAIALVPLLYGALYLWAFYDPYGNVDKIPVAVVNLDEGAELNDGSTLEVGDDLVQAMKDADEGMGWVYTDARDAQEGLEDGRYYMKLVIPADLSEKVATAEDDDPEKGSIILVHNQAHNLIASMLTSAAVTRVQAELNSTIAQTYFDTILTEVADSTTDLQDAVDGSRELADGLQDAVDGSDKLTDGLKDAYDGSGDLKDGTSDLVDGVTTLKDGTGQLVDGAGDLNDGAQQLKDGTSQLRDGSTQLLDGSAQLVSGSADLKNGIVTLHDGAGQL